ncbi:MAG: efflux RND transporter periplasmic adaptor subunit [Bacteroidetes bacterium]|nr:efflux RND transporter periplasmic adaptor subunit [Bacteroidota bacterium]
MKKSIINSILILITLVSFTACQNDHSADDGHNHDAASTTTDSHDEHEEGLHLTKAQIKTIGLKFGAVENIKVNDFVKATGTLGVPPNGLTAVSPKAGGIIKTTIKLVEGDFIKKGTLVAYLENPEFITKQQDFLQTKANLEFTKAEFQRQQNLLNANAGVEKNVQQLQAQLSTEEAKMQGLSKYLNYLGINTASLNSQNITEKVGIYAPVSGYISNIKMHNGMFVQQGNSLFEILDNSHVHLELDVFEKDVAKIKKGQLISYTVPAIGSEIFEGEVEIIGKEFNTDNKTVRVHGHLDGKQPQFIKDLFLNAKIWLNNQTATALPEKAIIRDGASSFVYVADNNTAEDEMEFFKIQVITGSTDNGFTAVQFVDTIPKNMQIVTEGAYFVFAQSKAGELTHEH